MDESIQFNWASLETLVPLCLEFCDQCRKGQDVDIRNMADKVGEAFGIEDIDNFANRRIRNGVESGLGRLFDGEESEELAKIFASMCKPIAEVVVAYAKGEKNASGFMGILGNIHLEGIERLKSILQKTPCISDRIADGLAKQFGPYLVSIYCFSAAYKIYCKAAQDAELAKMHRIEIERFLCEAIEHLKIQRAEMERLLDDALLSRLVPFDKAIGAMDKAVLFDDDDAFVAANSDLRVLFGGRMQYRNKEEFEVLMLSDETFRL